MNVRRLLTFYCSLMLSAVFGQVTAQGVGRTIPGEGRPAKTKNGGYADVDWFHINKY
jgi:hypothetical protein